MKNNELYSYTPGQDVRLTQDTSPAWWLVPINIWANWSNDIEDFSILTGRLCVLSVVFAYNPMVSKPLTDGSNAKSRKPVVCTSNKVNHV